MKTYESAYTRTDEEVMAEMKGKVLKSFDLEPSNAREDLVIFTFDDDTKYGFCHHQDCCEYVYLAEVIGDPADLVGLELLGSEVISHDGSDPILESSTWTFYKFWTMNGYVTLRFLGTSNGYYSESVDVYRIR